MKSKIYHQYEVILADKRRLMFEFGIEKGVEYVSVGRKSETGICDYVKYSYEEWIIMFTELATMMHTKDFVSVMQTERYINAATEIQIGADSYATYPKSGG